ncbi:Pickpocket protein 28 [Gryllus bimaculatus]|nr:Pickpocket protein 28 [Gryllus bimaculatus]
MTWILWGSGNASDSRPGKSNDTQVYDSSAAAVNESDGCLLRHNTACGTASGLEVYLRHFPQEDSLGDGQRLGQGHRVLVHQPDDFPEEGGSIFVPQQRLGLALAGTVKVSPSLTESSAEVRALQPAVRGCLFADERRLLVSRQYSLQSCLLECRLRHLAAQCGCLPYFFAGLPLPNVSECTFAQIACLSKHSADLRFYRPPERMRGVEGRLRERIWQRLVDRGIDCSHCLPTCHDSTYDLEADVTTDNKLTSSNTTYLDIFYKDLYAVKYGRELSFGETELLVSFGGIASLFLGVSVLSGFELLYYLCKLCAALACGGRGRVAPRRTPMRVAARAAAQSCGAAAPPPTRRRPNARAAGGVRRER